jgi:phenylpyruvate tautomerase PptA (4-oxalocrotonate tautomerase family)
MVAGAERSATGEDIACLVNCPMLFEANMRRLRSPPVSALSTKKTRYASGGKPASHPIIALLVNAIKGGLDDPARKRLIEESTAILNKYAASKVLTYVAIQEIPEIDWGMYGKQVDLSAMRAPATA